MHGIPRSSCTVFKLFFCVICTFLKLLYDSQAIISFPLKTENKVYTLCSFWVHIDVKMKKGYASAPVSYTHLDVYKRQTLPYMMYQIPMYPTSSVKPLNIVISF